VGVELPDDPRAFGGGACLSLDRLDSFVMVARGIETHNRLSYAAGLISTSVKQLRLVFKKGMPAVVPVDGEVFLMLWEGVDNARRIEFLTGAGRVMARCNFSGDLDPC